MGRSRQRWGWHQLSSGAAKRLVDDAGLPEGALVLDLGAGHGAITAPLVDAGMRVVAFELHPQRARRLDERFGGRVTVVRADIADLRLPRRPFHVVANPPYAIVTAVLKRLLGRGTRLQSATLVVPRWTVQRWTTSGAPGAGRWAHTFETQAGPVIPRQAFRPPPKSHSQVLTITRR